MKRPPTLDADLLVAGGGLAGGLIALALAARRPELRVRVVEPGEPGGNHVWSFFGPDVAAADRALVEPLVAHRWPAYDVAFPGRARTIGEPYHSIESERLAAALRAALPADGLIAGTVVAATPTTLALADGRTLTAGGVVDARGPGDLATLRVGWQKFVGRLLAVEGGHGLARPVVMDATVPQLDGYRFVYLLPFDGGRVFVEDTYYSDGPELDHAAIAGRIDAYAAGRGWRVAGATREERGVLPVVIGGDFAAYWRSTGEGVAKAGVRAGLFHATTGYSLPDAVRLASALVAQPDLSGGALAAMTRAHAGRAWARRGFYRLLDAMLFDAAAPAERWRVMARFYGLSAALIGRFYAGTSTPLDKARILAGKPPVPVGRAIRAIMGNT